MKLTIHGAAKTVTGSMYLIEACGKRILMECGFFQGRRKESMDRNRQFPFAPKDVDFMFLSHAHIDHSGNIPNLVRQGFEGPIFCTHATRDLGALMLEDSAHIQEADAAFINKWNAKHGKGNEPVAEPLYTIIEARRAVQQLTSIAYDRSFTVAEGIMVTFCDAGHILGSAEVIVDVQENGRHSRLVFSGDVGRGKNEIFRDPTPYEDADALIMECTYGGREHGPREVAWAKLAEVISQTVAKGGKIIIPSFAVDRTQQLIYALHELTDEKRVPSLPIYVDSPLAVNATEVFRMHPECFNEATYEKLQKSHNPFNLQKLTYIRDVEESKALNDRKEPCIIISSSGMCEAGRIRHHLRNNIGNPKNTILMVGFCAPYTLGRFLIDRQPTVNIFGEKFTVEARVEVIDAFSAHADTSELLDLAARSTGSFGQIILAHCQEEACQAIATGLKPRYPNARISIPNLHDSFEL
jgi:metallo-beta-lactamase family protein